MADRYHLYPLTGAGSLQVEGLAKRVIDDLGRSSPAESRKRVVETTIWLANISITNATYEQDDVLRALMKRGLTRILLSIAAFPTPHASWAMAGWKIFAPSAKFRLGPRAFKRY